MASQFIELIIFAGIAFFIINKLIAALGSTSEDEQAKRRSFFGEPVSLKDVTHTEVPSAKQSEEKPANANNLESFSQEIQAEFATLGDKIENHRNYAILRSRVPNFSAVKFLNSAKIVFKMIIELNVSDPEKLTTLIDKRYLAQFKALASRYNGPVNDNNLTAKLEDIHMFGNSVFIKVLFMGKNVMSNIAELKEEWTFSKNLTKPGPEWRLSNVEQA